jgi:hypothetical protein
MAERAGEKQSQGELRRIKKTQTRSGAECFCILFALRCAALRCMGVYCVGVV